MEAVLLTVIVSLLSGAGGAYLSTLMRLRHEREERIRERMLSAADDFGTGLLQAILGIRDARTAMVDLIEEDRVKQNVDWQAVDEPVVVEAQRRVDVVHDRLARVQLLFGEGTETSVKAEAAILELRAAVADLGDWPRPNLESAWARAGSLIELHRGYNRAALVAIRSKRLPALTTTDQPAIEAATTNDGA